jgi:hypothetical protein
LEILEVRWPKACHFCGGTSGLQVYTSRHRKGEYLFLCQAPDCQSRAREDHYRRVAMPRRVIPVAYHKVGNRYAVTTFLDHIPKRRHAGT